VERMLLQRQTLPVSIFLLVENLVRTLQCQIVVGDAQRLLDLLSAERIAHRPVSRAVSLEQRERGGLRFGGTLQHNQGSNGVTMGGRCAETALCRCPSPERLH